MTSINYIINTWNTFISIFNGIGVKEDDSDFLKLQKSILTANAFLVATLAVFWSLLYISIGLVASGLIPLTYAVLSYISIIIFKMNKKLTFFQNSQLIMILLLPFALMFSLGGLKNSSVVIVWAILAPIGGLLFANYKKAYYWLVLFLVLLFFSGYIESLYLNAPVIKPAIINFFYIINIGGLTLVLYIILLYFVDQRTKAFDVLNNVAKNSFSNLIDNLKLEESTISENNSESVLFMIINSSGLAKFSKIFSERTQYNDQMIAGFLSAINSFSQETFGETFLKQISYRNFFMLFETIKDYRFVYAFKGDQKIAEKRLIAFKQELLKDEYKNVFQDDNKEIDQDSQFAQLVLKYF